MQHEFLRIHVIIDNIKNAFARDRKFNRKILVGSEMYMNEFTIDIIILYIIERFYQ